ncbi:MAG: hypothetical protein WC551_10510 [Patescibacteria group bacterium]
MCFFPAISWALFALGGTQISDKTPGWKGWRRFILPVFYLLAILLAGHPVAAVLVAGMAVIAYVQPYGDRTSWFLKFLVGCGYACIGLPLGWSAWNVVTALGFITLFALSNFALTRKIVVWKICEGFFGLLVGIQVAYQLIK